MIANEDNAPSNAELFVSLLHSWVKHREVHKACKELAGKKIKYITAAKDVPQERAAKPDAAKSTDIKSDDDAAMPDDEGEEESKSAVEPEFDSD